MITRRVQIVEKASDTCEFDSVLVIAQAIQESWNRSYRQRTGRPCEPFRILAIPQLLALAPIAIDAAGKHERPSDRVAGVEKCPRRAEDPRPRHEDIFEEKNAHRLSAIDGHEAIDCGLPKAQLAWTAPEERRNGSLEVEFRNELLERVRRLAVAPGRNDN